MERLQRANCKLALSEFQKPSERQRYLFVDDRERVGALRTSYLKNCCITEPNTGRHLYQHGYEPEIDKKIHGHTNVYENGVAECLGHWRVMTPSSSPEENLNDYITMNKYCGMLSFAKESEYNTYRKYADLKRSRNKCTGRRDQTIFYPKGLAFGKCSGETECFYDILSNKEAHQWLRDRKIKDEQICKALIEKWHQFAHPVSTRSSEMLSQYNHTKLHPPEPSPRAPTKLRLRAKAKISSFWDSNEVLKLLDGHPEFEERVQYFSIPSSHNLYYNEVNRPGKVNFQMKVPDSYKSSKCGDQLDDLDETLNEKLPSLEPPVRLPPLCKNGSIVSNTVHEADCERPPGCNEDYAKHVHFLNC